MSAEGQPASAAGPAAEAPGGGDDNDKSQKKRYCPYCVEYVKQRHASLSIQYITMQAVDNKNVCIVSSVAMERICL